MQVDTEQLATATELALFLGVSQSAFSNWITRHSDFPKPVIAHGERIKLWIRDDVIRWYAKHVGADAVGLQLERARAIVAALEKEAR